MNRELIKQQLWKDVYLSCANHEQAAKLAAIAIESFDEKFPEEVKTKEQAVAEYGNQFSDDQMGRIKTTPCPICYKQGATDTIAYNMVAYKMNYNPDSKLRELREWVMELQAEYHRQNTEKTMMYMRPVAWKIIDKIDELLKQTT